MKRLAALALAAAVLTGGPALAVQPDEILDDPALEARARGLGADLRCLVCQNQSIDDSDAPLARDLRILLRDRLVAGDTDEEAIAYIVDRYGDYVLLNPPFKTATLLLWLAPALALAGGAAVLFLRSRGRSGDDPAAELTDDERRRLDALLAGDDR